MNAQPLDNDTNGTVPLTRDARRALAAPFDSPPELISPARPM